MVSGISPGVDLYSDNPGSPAKFMIDVSYDFRTDANGKDPDQSSPTLRKYHQILWSKPLPNGKPFLLDRSTAGAYLHHKSELGEFFLSSDSITHTYSKWESMSHIMQQIPQTERDHFMQLGYTIGGFILFPSNKVNNRPTINGARGMSRIIADRFDLTLECIRRFYQQQTSPLYTTLICYKDFFDLFDDFRGYIDFFLLQDLVADDYSAMHFWRPFDDFLSPPVPQDINDYLSYRQKVSDFLAARNKRLLQAQPILPGSFNL